MDPHPRRPRGGGGAFALGSHADICYNNLAPPLSRGYPVRAESPPGRNGLKVCFAKAGRGSSLKKPSQHYSIPDQAKQFRNVFHSSQKIYILIREKLRV